MNYFVSKKEMDEMRENMFTAIAKCLSDLESKLTLLVNAVHGRTRTAEETKKKSRRKGMSDETTQELLEVLKDIAQKSKDESLQYVAKKLEERFTKLTSDLKEFNKSVKDINKRIEALEQKGAS